VIMEGVSYLSALLKMLFALGLVLALMVATVYFLKRTLGQTVASRSQDEVINVIVARSLGPRTSILIVEVLGKVSVLGVSAGNMQLIASIDDEKQLARLSQLKKAAPLPSPIWEKIRRKARKP